MAFIDDALREHVRLMSEIAGKDKEISALRDAAKIAREAIDMFCHPSMRDSAEKWLRAKGI